MTVEVTRLAPLIPAPASAGAGSSGNPELIRHSGTARLAPDPNPDAGIVLVFWIPGSRFQRAPE